MSSEAEKQPKLLSLDAIDKGVAIVEEKKLPDAEDHLEMEELVAATLRNELARSRIKNVRADRKMRKKYAGRILIYLEIYSGVVAVLLLLAGFKIFGFSLPTEILASLVGSTAVAAIGLVGFIARGLFRPPPPETSA